MKNNKLLPTIIAFISILLFYAVVQLLLSWGTLNRFQEVTLITMGINVILAVSLNLIVGFTGQLNLGHAGFMAVGAYLSGVLTMKLGFPFLPALLLGALGAAVTGLLLGIPTLRLKGDYLAIATLGFGEIVRNVIVNIEYLGGAAGLIGIPSHTNWSWVFLFTVLTVLVIRNFTASSFGRVCVAIREDELATEAIGVDTTYIKVLAFTVGAFFAGVAGSLFAHYFYVIQPATFSFMRSFDILVMTVLGGLGSITGSVIAAVAITFLNTLLQPLGPLRMVIYAALLILIMIFRPQGLMGSKEFTYATLRRLVGVKNTGEQKDELT